ncbi:MAG TPA: hypothetical protein EYO33_20505 [Phycisphaerales bacterium]|nr:hypothetical protein [Phycisphaerales bacterium]
MAISSHHRKLVQHHLTRLSPQGQEAYRAVKKRTSRLQKNAGDRYIQVADAVDKLLLEGKLESAKDAEGESLVKNLADLCGNKDIPKTYRNDTIGWTITHLTYPETSLNQVDSKGTCTATVLAYDLAQENGAEFTRLVDGLMSRQRAVTLANGEVMKRAVSSVQGNISTGTPVSSMLQASFMDFAVPEDVYRIRKDEFEGTQDTGLAPEALKRLYEAVENRRLETRPVSGEEMRVLLGSVDDSIPVCLRWSEREKTDESSVETAEKEPEHSYHMVLVKAQDENWVEFRNPWGPTKSKQLSEFGRQILDNGHERFPRAEFYKRLNYAVIPEGWAMTADQERNWSIKAPLPTGRPIEREAPQAPEPESSLDRTLAQQEAIIAGPLPPPVESPKEKGILASILGLFA